jgi:hypothetical protein
MVPIRRTSRTPSYVSMPLVSSPIRSPTLAAVLDRAALGHQVEVGDRRGAAQRVGRVEWPWKNVRAWAGAPRNAA